MVVDGGVVGGFPCEAGGSLAGGATAKHLAEVARLRAVVVDLVHHAKILLHGDGYEKVGKAPSHAKAIERDQEMEVTLEKTEWYRKENKLLRQQVEGAYNRRPSGPSDPRERDPMELQNLLVERRKELQRLKKDGAGLDRVAEAQRRAETTQNSINPEVEAKLRRMKGQVDQQKMMNVKLQAERQKMNELRIKTEEDVRSAGSDLRNKAAELRRPPQSHRSDNGNGKGDDQKSVKQLQRDMDIVRDAIEKDDRRFKAAMREDRQESEDTSKQMGMHQESIQKLEVEIAKHQCLLRASNGGSEGGVPRGQRITPRKRSKPTRERPKPVSCVESRRCASVEEDSRARENEESGQEAGEQAVAAEMQSDQSDEV
eukprot:TRINITY_DN48773_c0_g1_i1.p1 TRINITY_DN48773_c0_g1~~TRINITY_DN48773_c0_g1_i1.p1  ORF type:complete len:371 (+),score=77.67 TRINITY_DN48773_c0_g1_i1:98-1210(+)